LSAFSAFGRLSVIKVTAPALFDQDVVVVHSSPRHASEGWHLMKKGSALLLAETPAFAGVTFKF
jgi:hypothetical protein